MIEQTVPVLKSARKVEAILKANNHPEKQHMLNVYVCIKCNHDAIYLYLDIGVTPVKMNCPKCGAEGSFTSTGGTRQPDILWYRPKNLDEIKEIIDSFITSESFKNNIDLKKLNMSVKEYKKQILKNYIVHYNQGGLFSKQRI